MSEQSPEPVEFTVVVACFREEHTVVDFHRRLSATLAALGRTSEIVFVNDGSDDSTWERLVGIFESDPRVGAIVDLFRNSGQAAAITAGIVEARGSHLVFLDSDLQLDPEDLPRLVEAFDRGADVVSGFRMTREDDAWRRVASRLGNAVLRRASGAPLRDFGCTFKIMNGAMVRAFGLGPAKPARLPHLMAAAGRCVEVPVSHHPRPHGRSGWTFSRLFAYNLENVLDLSDRPFQILGASLFALAALVVVRVVLGPFFSVRILPEVSGGLLLNALVAGILLVLALFASVGEYVMRAYRMLQGRPAYIVRTVKRRPR